VVADVESARRDNAVSKEMIMHLFSVRGFSTFLAGSVLVAGTVYAIAAQQMGTTSKTSVVNLMSTPTGIRAEPYGFDTMANGDAVSKVLVTDGFGFTWCLTVFKTGPGTFSGTGTVNIGSGCTFTTWNATMTATQTSGSSFSITMAALNLEACSACTSCFEYVGTWNRNSNQGSGSWTSYCAGAGQCTSAISSGTWSAVAQPGGC
jgi:Pyruvate/2-oxoacid:ferredoxin oxidoreductase delta subunit